MEKLAALQRHFNIFLNETELRSRIALTEYNLAALNKLTDKMEKTISIQPEQLIKNKAEYIFESTLHEVRHELHRFDENFHLIRKKLKDVFYWSKMLPGNFYFSDDETKILDNALENLGSGHDCEIMKKQARQYRGNFVIKGSHEFMTLKEFEKLLKENKQKKLDDAHELIKELLKEHKKTDEKIMNR
jgi:hypothetical protein